MLLRAYYAACAREPARFTAATAAWPGESTFASLGCLLPCISLLISLANTLAIRASLLAADLHRAAPKCLHADFHFLDAAYGDREII